MKQHAKHGARCRYAVMTVSFLLLAGMEPAPAPPAQEQATEWRVPRRAARKKNKVRADAKSIALGKKLFERECMSCHGPTGKGDGPAAKDLEKTPGNLSDPKMWQQSDGALYWKMKTGRTPMPSFVTLLSNKEKWHVVNYVRTLAPRIQTTSPEFNVPEGMRAALSRTLPPYLEVVESLVNGDAARAKTGADELLDATKGLMAAAAEKLAKPTRAEWESSVKAVQSAASALASSSDLTTLRSSLMTVSECMANAMKKFGHGERDPLYLFFCPETGNGKGALWVQRGGRPRNPYLGTRKTTCGQVRSILGGRVSNTKKPRKGGSE